VAELVDAQDLGSCDESRGGSRPSARTNPAGLVSGCLGSAMPRVAAAGH
jgi:hypothetical protein